MLLAYMFEVAVAILFVVFVVHGFRRYAYRRFVYTIVLLGFVMWLQEHLAMNVLAPGFYHYSGFAVWLWDVPLAIPLAWILVCHLSFQIAVRTRRFSAGALAGCSVDLLLEPLAFMWGLWTWKTPPFPDLLYFNAPLGNAIGWLLWCYIGARILNATLKLK